MIYLRLIDIIKLSFVSNRFSEIAYGNKPFRKDWELSNTIINKSELYDCFMKRFRELIERLDSNFNFIDMLFLNYCFQSLKIEFCFTNVLSHLLFCNRSSNSNGQCRLCSQLYIKDGNHFVSSIKLIFL